MPNTFRLTARPFTRNAPDHRGVATISTVLFQTKARVEVVAASLSELETKIAAFGAAHAPCNVWVGCEGRKPRGFDQWNRSAERWLFDAPAAQPTAEG